MKIELNKKTAIVQLNCTRLTYVMILLVSNVAIRNG